MRNLSCSFADPSTQLEIVRSQTPVTEDGFKIHEPTGEIKCCACGEQAARPEDIHEDDSDCEQSDLTSRWDQLQ